MVNKNSSLPRDAPSDQPEDGRSVPAKKCGALKWFSLLSFGLQACKMATPFLNRIRCLQNPGIGVG